MLKALRALEEFLFVVAMLLVIVSLLNGVWPKTPDTQVCRGEDVSSLNIPYDSKVVFVECQRPQVGGTELFLNSQEKRISYD